MSGIILTTIVLLSLAVALLWQQMQARAFSRFSWQELIATLETPDMKGITLLALGHRHPSVSSLIVPSNESWKKIDGWRGLMRMRRNQLVLLALVEHAERWNLDESVGTGALLRRDAKQLKRSLVRVIVDLCLLRGEAKRSIAIGCAANAYYTMTENALIMLRRLSLLECLDLEERLWGSAQPAG